MPKKKGKNKQIPKDFTLNDCANAQKPLSRVKKSTSTPAVSLPEVSWDEIPDDDDFDIVNEPNPDGTMNLVCIKKRKTKPENNKGNYNEYPEVVWYQISKHIKPEDIGRFARINRTTYEITKQKSFWWDFYDKYCKGHPKLPPKLQIESGCKTYGLRTRVIRALYYTYDFFINKVYEMAMHDSKPHDMIKLRCVTVWFHKGMSHWAVFFKFKPQMLKTTSRKDMLSVLSQIDANPEEDSKVLQVNCQFFNEIPPLMGMTLTSVKVALAKGLRHHRLFMGFNSSHYVSKKVLPECSIVLDTVISIMAIEWWHPNYPHFTIRYPWDAEEEEIMPFLKRDFFAPRRDGFGVS